MTKTNDRPRWVRALLPAALLLALLLCLAAAAGGRGQLTGWLTGRADDSRGWQLTLVDGSHRLRGDPQIELTLLDNGERVDSRIYPHLQQMFDDARSQGVYPIVRDGFRTWEEQRAILAAKTAAYQEEGLSRRAARQAAGEWVAQPGASEHQLGLAVDINSADDRSTDQQVYDWLALHAWEYGFILRYPEDKTDLTGMIWEPWHYRYVGYDAAAAMQDQDLCLEEYIAALE